MSQKKNLGVCMCVLLAACVLLGSVSPMRAGIIVSEEFSLGYGFTNSPQTWNTSETAGANTPTTIGDFTFTPVVSGGATSGTGPRFPNRVFTAGAAGYGSGSSSSFSVSVAASYAGSLPPNAQTRVLIDEISVWAAALGVDGSDPYNIAFRETTSGHTAQSAPVTGLFPFESLGGSWWLQLGDVSHYKHLVWNPGDYWVPGSGTTRSFDLVADNGRVIDGFEIRGHVVTASAPGPMFTYFSTPDTPAMSMPAQQGWTQVGSWDAGDESGYAGSVSPNPGYVAHEHVTTGNSGYFFQELTPQQEASALAYGWELNLRARFYQTWNSGLSTDPDRNLGFGVKTSAGDVSVGFDTQRSGSTYATVVGLFGGDATQMTPGLGQADALYPSYMDYTLSYDPESGATTLTVTDAHTGHVASHTLVNTLGPSTGLLDGGGGSLSAAVYFGVPNNYFADGHAYFDYLSFQIFVPEPDSAVIMLLALGGFGLVWSRRRQR